MRTALEELQRGLFRSLTSHQPLMDKVSGIKDGVEEGQPFPYCTIGEPVVTPTQTKTSTREEIVWVLHCWSQYPGKKEAIEILNLMNQAFTAQPLQLGGGFYVFDFRPNGMRVITDVDGVTRHGILRVRVIIYQ